MDTSLSPSSASGEGATLTRREGAAAEEEKEEEEEKRNLPPRDGGDDAEAAAAAAAAVAGASFEERYQRLNGMMDVFAMLKELREMVLEGRLSKGTYDEIYRIQVGAANTRRDSAFSRGLLSLAREDAGNSPSFFAASHVQHAGFVAGRSDASLPHIRAMGEANALHGSARASFSPIVRSKARFVDADSLSFGQEVPIIQGYLFKWTKMVTKHWRKRYFALFTSRLEYYANEEHFGKRPKSIMWINEDFYVAESLQVNSGNNKINGFIISDFAKTLLLAAEHPEEKHAWMFAITRAIRKLQEISEHKDEPVLIGRPTRTPSVVAHDTNFRLAEYKRHLMAYGATSPIEQEEKIQQGELPNFSTVPPIETFVGEDVASAAAAAARSRNIIYGADATVPSNLSEPVALKKELADAIGARRGDASPPSIAPRPVRPLFDPPSTPPDGSTSIFSSLGRALGSASSQQPLGSLFERQAESNDKRPIEEKLRECRHLVDACSDEHEHLRVKLAKVNADEARLARQESSALAAVAEAEEYRDGFREVEQDLLNEIEALTKQCKDTEASLETFRTQSQANIRHPHFATSSGINLTTPRFATSSGINLTMRPQSLDLSPKGRPNYDTSIVTDINEDGSGSGSVHRVNEMSPSLLEIGDNFDRVRESSKEWAVDNTDSDSVVGETSPRSNDKKSKAKKKTSSANWFSLRARSASHPNVKEGDDDLHHHTSNGRKSPEKRNSAPTTLAELSFFLETIKANLKRANHQLDEARENLETAESDLESKTQAADEISAKLTQMRREVSVLTSEFRELQNALAAHREREARLMRARNELRKEAANTPTPQPKTRNQVTLLQKEDSERRVSSTQALQIKKSQPGTSQFLTRMEIAELEGELVT